METRVPSPGSLETSATGALGLAAGLEFDDHTGKLGDGLMLIELA